MKNPVIKKVFLKAADSQRPQDCFAHPGDLRKRWIWIPQKQASPTEVVLFRRRLTLAKALRTRIHITADQRFDLFINGELLARGPELGDSDHWFVHSYDLCLPAGSHTLIARCRQLGEMAPLAQMARGRGGFLLVATGKGDQLLTTGVAAWEACVSKAYRFKRPWITWGTQGDTFVDGAELSADPVEMNDLTWTVPPMTEPAGSGIAGLLPSSLPDMLYEPFPAARVRHAANVNDQEAALLPLHELGSSLSLISGMQNLLNGGTPLTVPPDTCAQWLLDFDNYLCAYPVLRVSGGAGSSIQVHWAESLYHPPHADNRKGNRDEIEGKIIHADGDTFYPDGRDLTFDLLWWRAGRYVQVLVETKEQPLTLTGLTFFETRYPLKTESRLSASNPDCERIIPLMRRALEMCMHETYMDCPYYEQLQYAGDTRTEVLATYALSRDDRLPRKALQCFDWSRQFSGLTQSRYPSVARQMIPTFSLWWICMVHDYMMWRSNPEFIASLLPGIRAVLDSFERWREDDGLLHDVSGWNFVDWSGKQASADDGLVNMQYVLALQAAAGIEAQTGTAVMARMYKQRAQRVRAAAVKCFWDFRKQLFADDRRHRNFSEHMQCLAVLAGACDAAKRRAIRKMLLSPNSLDKATIYFMHYLFEALPELDAMPYFFERLEAWICLPAKGFKTLPETPEPARSDCHAWGAHPLYHFYTKLLGITPASPGFATVRIEPRPCHLRKLSGTLPHPKGLIRISINLDKGFADISLPKSVPGILIWENRSLLLKGGRQVIRL